MSPPSATADLGSGDTAHRSGQRRRVILLDAMLLIGAALFLIPTLPHLHERYAVTHIPWWALAVLWLATDIYSLDVAIRRHHHTYTLTELALLVGLFFCSPAELLLARAASAVAVYVIWRRQELVKLVFNVSLQAFIVCGSVFLVRSALGEVVRPGVALWLVAYLVVWGAALASAHLVALAITIYQGRLPASVARWNTVAALVSGFVQATLALLVVGLVWDDTQSAWLLVAVAAILLGFFRAYASLVERHNSTELLYEFTRVGGGSPSIDDVLRAVLFQARDLVRAERAEIAWAPGSADSAFVFHVAADDSLVEMRQPVDSAVALAARYGVVDGRSIVLPRSVRDATLRGRLAERGARDAAVVPLHGDDGISGVLMVADRLGGVRTFGNTELRLLETLASHASVSLQNARLIDRLRHDALHDALTGLPNRAQLQHHVDDAIRVAERDQHCLAVALMDLDGFKEINDTLGHDNGDVLLREVAKRLTGGLGHGQALARLGGDEFAILLPKVGDEGDVIDRARHIQQVLESPYSVSGLTLELRATTGVALYPDHGTDAATLLQRAEVAMYYAKSAATGVELYASERDEYSPRRLALVSELRRAIDNSELVVHYQPKLDLQTGFVIGAEALVRWEHPQHGLLSPDQFVPVAEHTGLVRPLSMYVLAAALDECREWRARGHSIGVAVNLSVRNLLDLDLPNKVRELLRSSGVPPAELTIELTESSVMSDPERVIEVLNRMNAMGVRLSVDDFGTGYSSLSYLKRLPVHEMKIDRSFVLSMSRDGSDTAIVRSIVDLGANLGLHVVAEGVEDAMTWDRLREFGCGSAQGYHMTRPLPAAHFRAWLDNRPEGHDPSVSKTPTLRRLRPA